MDYYLVVYDISDDRNRLRLAKWLEDEQGIRINRSVYELWLSKARLAVLWRKLEEWTDEDTDQVAIYYLCGKYQKKVLYLPAWEPEEEGNGPWVV